MSEKKYDKLVRNKIPEIIEKSGKVAVTRVLSDEEYRVYLEKKLDEEVAEFHESKSLEELADIIEVVHALADYDIDTVDELYKKWYWKGIERGGFSEKILLMEVREGGDQNG